MSGLKTANDITDRNRLLPLDELYADLDSCKAATKLLIVDACRNDPTSPSVFRESLASSTLPKLPAPTGGTAAFFSCKANQRAVEDAALKQGVFSHFLVKALKGEADLPLAGKPADGVVTFAELSAYVANNTYSHVFDKFKVSQSPELRGDYDLNLPIARFYDSPAIATPWTDKQLDQQLSSTFKTRLLYETSVMNQTKELEKEDHALEFVLSAYEYHRDISAFGLKSEYAELRGQILLALKSVEAVLKNPPDEKENPKRHRRVNAVHTLIAKWLTWDTFSDEVRGRLVAMHPKLDKDNLEPATRDNFYRKTKATAVLAVRPTFPESAHASLVLRALRDRYWTLSMHSHQPSQRLPQLQLTTLLKCTSLPDNSSANIPRDRPVVVQFSGFTWCPPCRDTLKGWKTIQDELGDAFSLVFVSVDSDQLDGKKIVEESGVQAIWLELGELGEEVMPVESFPSAFFCDAAGRVVEPSTYDQSGYGLTPRNEDQTQDVLKRLRELIADATP